MCNLILVLIILAVHNVTTRQDSLGSDLNGLSELPLEKLLQFKSSLGNDENFDEYEERIMIENEKRIADMLDTSEAQASALQGKFKKPVQRGSYEMWEKKGSKKNLSKIFQLTVTALAFLAFAGYLLCLLVQAIRAKQNSTGTTAGGAFVISAANRRRPIIIRQKRDLIWPEAEPEELYYALRQFSEGFANYHTIDYKHYNYTVDSLG